MTRAASADHDSRYVRYQTTMAHGRREGVYLGIFATVNTLAKAGRLNADQEAFRQRTNAWFNAHMPLPTDSMPELYTDSTPQSVAWFKRTATTHLAQLPGYLSILEAHGVGWFVIASDDPGTILYEDAFQVVATPCPPSP